MFLICLDNFDRHKLAILAGVDRLVDFAVGAFSDLFDLLVGGLGNVDFVNQTQFHFFF